MRKNLQTVTEVSLQTVDEVVDALGGADAALKLTGCESASVIPVWKHRGKFPAYTYIPISGALQAKGKTASASLWKQNRKHHRG